MLPVHHFRHQGKQYTLRKRTADRFAAWYFVSAVRGKRFNHALGSNDVRLAEQAARNKYIVPALQEDWQRVDAGKLKRHFATVGEVLAAWRGMVLKNEEPHRRAAANALLNLLRRVGFAQPEVVSTEQLTGRLVRRYFDAAGKACAGLEQMAAARARSTANSLFNQAKSVFKAGALARYADAGIALPDMDDFIRAGKAERFDKGAEVEMEPPPLALVQAVRSGWPAVREWNTFAAVGLELAFGLRAGEAAQARWNWLVVEDGLWVMDARAWLAGQRASGAKVKRRSGTLRVTALNPFFTVFRARALAEGRWGVGETVLEGTPTARRDGAFRAVGAWLRGLGWDLQKTNHGLRAWAGAQVVVRYGHGAAQLWLRHKSVTTTERHYTGRWVDEAALRRGSDVEWARA